MSRHEGRMRTRAGPYRVRRSPLNLGARCLSGTVPRSRAPRGQVRAQRRSKRSALVKERT
ncbi:hypothetical protein OB08_00955 [Microbacterium sp. HJ5]